MGGEVEGAGVLVRGSVGVRLVVAGLVRALVSAAVVLAVAVVVGSGGRGVGGWIVRGGVVPPGSVLLSGLRAPSFGLLPELLSPLLFGLPVSVSRAPSLSPVLSWPVV